ncbi:MAG: type I-B CRISPR-associated protein Cas7/Csh2 [Bacillota bacterium]|jgi:CRISPR-associated protein Csh2|nr:type I-B CRISPR-associated protein Cas7/Csh2 [Bacillota bacterium]
MAFANRREFLFVYSVKDANPNGDPLNANHPRYDEDTGKVLVSDVRIKRTIRDQWIRDGLTVFVDGELKTLKSRSDELKKLFDAKSGQDALIGCIDARLFGATHSLKGDQFSWTGPVQFKWGRSLNRTRVDLVQGTAAFATTETADQRSFRNEYIVPFALIAVYGIANQYASQQTGATDEDIASMVNALWTGTLNLITRSKVGHQSHLLMEVTYKEGFNGIARSLDERVVLRSLGGDQLSDEEQLALRGVSEVKLDIEDACEAILHHSDSIEKVRVIHSQDLEISGLELLETLGSRLVVEAR